MIHNKIVVVVLPAYQAEKTLELTYQQIPMDLVDHILMVDDASTDGTVEMAKRLGIRTIVHSKNRGYGANQKTCYTEAMRLGADIVVMLHPDYQYEPRLISAIAAMIASEVYDCVIGSRILGSTAYRGGMPIYKYIANRFLTAFQNILMGTKLSEFHTGYRAFSRQVLETLSLRANSNDFLFDNQMLAQVVGRNYEIGEISCPTRYSADSSSINFGRSVIYGVGVIVTSLSYRMWRWHICKPRLFSDSTTLRLNQEDS